MLKEISVAVLLIMLLPFAPLLGERNITVLNPHETPEVGGDWTVFFETSGTGILKITNLYPDEIEFNSLYRAEIYAEVDGEWEKVDPVVSNDTIYIFWNHKLGKVIYKVNKKGSHELRFEFGNVDYAHNSAGQATQMEFVLNITDPLIVYKQTHLNTSDESSFRFGGSETKYSGISLPKNITLEYAHLNITGKITYSFTQAPGTVYDLKIADILYQTGNETVLSVGRQGPTYKRVQVRNNTLEMGNNAINWTFPSSYELDANSIALDVGDIDSTLPGLEVAVATSSNNQTVFLLNETGEEIWQFAVPFSIEDIAVGELNSTYSGYEIAFGMSNGNLTVLNASADIIWTVSAGGGVKAIGIGNVNDSTGNELVLSYNNYIEVYNNTGSLLWTESIPSGTINDLVVENVTGGEYYEIVLGDNEGYIRRLNASRKWWNTQVGSGVLAVGAGDIDSSSPEMEMLAGTSTEIIAYNSTGSYLFDYDVSTVNVIATGNVNSTKGGNEVVIGTGETGAGNIYIFNFDDFPTDPYLEIGGDISSGWDWSDIGKFRTNDEILNASMWANLSNYMISCDAWLCDVPFTVNSTYAGEFIFDINVTYEYNLSSFIEFELLDVWSRTYEVMVNETVGNQSYNVTFVLNPMENVQVRYIVLNDTATGCHFNNTIYNMSASGCDVTDFIITPAGGLPPSALYWDNNMSSTMPVVMNTSLNLYSAPWKQKNITIQNDTVHGPDRVFYNITANISFAGQGFANPITFSVDWWSNGTFWNITPDTLVTNCNATNPTYESKVLGSRVFFICGQDTDGDTQMDYLKWKQPQTFFNDSSQINYMLNGTGNTPPVYWSESVSVTPETEMWGQVFNFSITFNDTEEDPVNITLFMCTPETGCLANETLNSTTTTNYTFIWNITSWNQWTNNTGDNYFYFRFKDPYIGWNDSEYFYGPNVIKRNATIEPDTNNTSVNRMGTNTTQLIFRVYDPNSTTYVDQGISCIANVTTDGSAYDLGNLETTNSSGHCNVTFDPDGNYSTLIQKFTVGVFNSNYYNDNITQIYGLEVEIDGDIDFSLSTSPTDAVDRWNESDQGYSNITWSLSGMQDDNGTAVTGYSVWVFWRGSLMDTTTQNQGFIDIPDDTPLAQADDYFTVTVGKQYFNNRTEISADYFVEGKLNFTILTPNSSQVMRTLGAPNRINLTINVTDELGNSVEDPDMEILWYIPQDGCVNLYNVSGNYTCELNPGPTTLGLYNWSVFINRTDYDWSANLTDSWIHVNGTMDLEIKTSGPVNRTTDMNITARIIDESLGVIGERGHNCTWYIDDEEVGTTPTNSSGYCVMNWTTQCSDPLGNYTINVSITGVNSSFWTPDTNNKTKYLHLMDVFYITVDTPNDTVAHRNEPFNLNATVFDSCGPATGFNITWYNESTNITDGTDVNHTWMIPDDYVLGYERINVTAVGGNYTANVSDFLVKIFGWAEPVWVSPTVNLTFGVEYNLTCLVRDNTTSIPLEGYNASFWQNESTPPPHAGMDIYIAQGVSNSTGHAMVNWSALYYNGIYGLICNLSDNETIWYNTSGLEAVAALPIFDNDPASINDTLISNSTVEANYQYTLLWANVTDDVGIDQVWAEVENDTSTANFSMSMQTTQLRAGYVEETWEIYYYPPVGGVYNVTIWANDTTNHTVGRFAGNFTAIGHTFSDMWIIAEDTYHETGRITETTPEKFQLTSYVNNTGNGTMYNTSVTFTSASGIYFSQQYNGPYYSTHRLDIGNVTPGSAYTTSNTWVRITTEPPLGNSTATLTLNWQNANLTEDQVINTTLINLSNTTYLELTDPDAGNSVIPSPVVDYIPNGTTRISKNLTVEAFGTTELEDVEITFGTCPISSWINFTPFWNVSTIEKNSYNTTSMNVTVPTGQSPSIQSCEVIVNATGSNSVCELPGESCTRQFTFELHIVAEEWNVTPSLLNKTVGQDSFGAVGTINLTNRGNDALFFNVSVFGASGNITAHNSTTNDELTNLTVDGFGNVPILIRWNATGAQAANFTATVVFDIDDPLRIPQQDNVTVFLNVTDVTFDIQWPNSISKKTDVVEDDVINITVDAQLGGNPIGAGEIGWEVTVGGEIIGSSVENNIPCKSISSAFNLSGDDMWNINCTAPSITGNIINNMLFVEGNITTQSIVTNDYELDAVVYRDVTPPLFTAINSSSIRPNGNFTLRFNVSDNKGIDNVTATLQYEGGSKTNITANLSYEGGDSWNCTLYNLTSIGDYWVNITAVDSSSFHHSNNSVVWFDVFNPIYFDGNIKDPLSSNVSAVFYFKIPSYKSYGRVVAHAFNTSGNSMFNQTLHKRIYDLEIKVFNHTIEYFNLSADVLGGNISSYLQLDDLQASAINVDPDVTSYSIIGVYMGNLFSYGSAAIRLNFSAAVPYKTHESLGDLYFSRFRVYRCDNWNFSSVSCSSSWSSVGGVVDDNPASPYYETVYLTTSATSAFGLIQCERDNCAGPSSPYVPPPVYIPGPGGSSGSTSYCGNDVCEAGENSENCPEDCGEGAVGIGAETTLSEVYMKPGENRSFSLTLSNTNPDVKSVYITLSGEIMKYIELSETFLNIPAQSSRNVDMIATIPADAEPGTYTGDIVITSEGRSRRIPVTLIISLEGATSIQLALNALTKQVSPGEVFKFNLIIYDLGLVKIVPANLTYNLKDVTTETILVQTQESMVIESTQSIIKSMEIPLNATLGNYFIEVIARYSNKTVSATDQLEIVLPFWTPERIGIALIFIIATTGTMLAYYSRKRYMQWKFEKAKYIFPVSYRALPVEKENSMWLGKIAETNRKAWFYPDLMTTHVLVSGSTGSGKSVTASVIAEEALEKKIPVIVFDPTAQWTGFVKSCTEKNMRENYPEFNMSDSDARPYKGMIFQVEDPNTYIDIRKYMNPGEITIFTLNKLKPGEYDTAVWNIVDSIFSISWEESPELKLLVVFDEVHRLLEKYGGRGGYVALEKAAREFRKWGIGLIMVSQVSSDFKEAIQGNVLTEIQMSTKSMTDIKRIESKFGPEFAKRISSEAIGVGMLQNPRFNRGKPYFVHFRPTRHSPHKLHDKDLETYKDFSARLDIIEEMISQKKRKGEDVMDYVLELKLAKEKLNSGRFRMAKIYLESLEKKLGVKGAS